jgi:hypothetical protein
MANNTTFSIKVKAKAESLVIVDELSLNFSLQIKKIPVNVAENIGT